MRTICSVLFCSLLFSLLFSSFTYIEIRILGLDEFMNVVADGAEEILIQNQTRIERNGFSSLSFPGG